MFPTFNQADIRTDADGMTFLDLEIQVLFNDQKVLFRYTFPATSNFKSGSHRDSSIGASINPDKHS